MDNIATKPEVIVFFLVLVVESVKALMLGTATAYQRGKLKKFINPEDANWLGGEVVIHDAPLTNRLFRAHRNTLENLLPFSLLALIFLVIGGNSSIGILYFITFTSSRMLHTYAYLSGKAMLRRNAYTLAWFVQIVMAVHVSTIFLAEVFFNGL